MATSVLKTTINGNIHKVWEIVLAVDRYGTWRRDLREAKMLNERQFMEYTNGGYATTFTVTAVEPYHRWEFDIENNNIKGHWIGIFTEKGNETGINFTEYATAKKILMKPFVPFYLRRQQAQFLADLKKALAQ